MQLASVITAQEEDERQQSANGLAESGGEGGTDNIELEYRDEEEVQQHIGAAGGDYHCKTHLGALGSHEEALEHILQHEHRVEYQTCARIGYTVGEKFTVRTEQLRDILCEYDSERGGGDAQYQRDYQHHGEHAACLVVVLLTQVFCYKGAAAGAYHESHAAEYHKERHDEIHRCERSLADEVGHEVAIHNSVDRCEHHHHHGGQAESEQPSQGEVVG